MQNNQTVDAMTAPKSTRATCFNGRGALKNDVRTAGSSKLTNTKPIHPIDTVRSQPVHACTTTAAQAPHKVITHPLQK
ncbi:MAG: hypothetical protein ACAH89_01440 [Rariglobus sp.]